MLSDPESQRMRSGLVNSLLCNVEQSEKVSGMQRDFCEGVGCHSC